MKKIILLICIVTLSLGYLSAQEEYYWSGGKKNYVEKMKDRYIVKLDKDKDVKTLEKSLVDKKQIKSLAKIKKQIGIVVAPEGFEKGKHFTNVVPAYRIGNLSFYPTGEILLQPKKSIGISPVLPHDCIVWFNV